MNKLIDLTANKSFLINLCLFFCCFPYIAPIPLDNDIQYPIFLLSLIIIIIDIITKKFYLYKIEILLLIFALLSFTYINYSLEYIYLYQKRLAPLCGFFIFYVFCRYNHLIKYELLTVFIILNFVLGLINLFFVKYFIFTFSPIVRIIKYAGFDDRGITGIMPEPSFLGALSLFFLLLSLYFFFNNKINFTLFLINTIFSIMMIIMSASSTGLAMLILFFISLIILLKTDLFLKIIFSILILIIFFLVVPILSNYTDFNSIKILSNLSFDEIYDNQSFYLRYVTLEIALLSFFSGNIFGSGVGTFPIIRDVYIHQTDYNIVSKSWVSPSEVSGVLSTFGNYLVEFGIIFLIFFLILIFIFKYTRINLIIRLNSILFIISSFSFAYPPLWLLLAITYKRKNKIVDKYVKQI